LIEMRLPLVYRVHAVQRMVERDISEEAVAEVMSAGKAIESYPDDRPYPSRLMLGWVRMGQTSERARPIHVVCAVTDHEIIVIKVYEPDSALWDAGFEKRKP